VGRVHCARQSLQGGRRVEGVFFLNKRNENGPGRGHKLESGKRKMRAFVAAVVLVAAFQAACVASELLTSQAVWVDGSNLRNAPTSASGPGARNNAAAAVVYGAGFEDMFVFGGIRGDVADTYNELWSWSFNTFTWNFEGGDMGISTNAGVYGTKGQESASNQPGARLWHTFIWPTGKPWMLLFGGQGRDINADNGWLNDVWIVTLPNLNWTWVAGGSVRNEKANYGTRGVESSTNTPSARRQHAMAYDSMNDRILMFGGEGYDTDDGQGRLNDLWSLNPSNFYWTWIAGTSDAGLAGVYGTKGVPSSSNRPGGRTAHSMGVDPLNEILYLYFGTGRASGASSGLLNDFWSYNISSDEWTWESGTDAIDDQGDFGTEGVSSPSNVPPAREYAQAVLDITNDRLVVVGGRRPGFTQFGNDIWSFDLQSKEWTWAGGQSSVNAPGVYGTMHVPDDSNEIGARHSGVMAGSQLLSSFVLFSGTGFDSTGLIGQLNDVWMLGVFEETTEPPTTEPPITTGATVTTGEPPTTEPPVTTGAAITTGEPPITTGEPPVTTGEPPITTGVPVTTGEPPVTTGATTGTTGEPLVTTGAPVTTGEPPVTTGTTGEPTVTTGEPPSARNDTPTIVAVSATLGTLLFLSFVFSVALCVALAGGGAGGRVAV